jgi:hypothetical protein
MLAENDIYKEMQERNELQSLGKSIFCILEFKPGGYPEKLVELWTLAT